MQRHLILAPLVALGLALTSGTAGAQQWERVRIATEGAYPPWNMTDPSGQLIGFELDLAQDLCARMEVECEIVAQDWDGIIPALQGGRYDAIMAAMSITDERREAISFSEPYATTPARFAVLADSDLAAHQGELDRIDLDEVDQAEDAALEELRQTLEGRTVGVQVATTHQNFIEEYLGDVVEVRRYDTQENLDLDLQAGRLDAALADMNYWVPLLETERGDNIALIGPSLVGGPVGEGIGVGIRQDDKELVEMFDRAIAAAREDGTIAELSEQWFGFDASS